MRRFTGGFQPKNKKPEDRKQKVANDGCVAQGGTGDIEARIQDIEEKVDQLSRTFADWARNGCLCPPPLKVLKLDPDAKIPTMVSDGYTGLGLYAAREITIHPGDIRQVHTGIAVDIPDGCYGHVVTDPSLAAIGVRDAGGATSIYPGHRGEVLLYIINDGIYPYTIKTGDMIAQMTIEAYLACVPVEVTELPDKD